MAKKFKLRYLIISLILIAIIATCSAFSVSYAKWVGTNTQLSASATIGNWGFNFSNMTDDDLKALLNDGKNGVITSSGRVYNLGDSIPLKEGESIVIFFDGRHIKGDWRSMLIFDSFKNNCQEKIDFSDDGNTMVCKNDGTFTIEGSVGFLGIFNWGEINEV